MFVQNSFTSASDPHSSSVILVVVVLIIITSALQMRLFGLPCCKTGVTKTFVKGQVANALGFAVCEGSVMVLRSASIA